MSEEKQMDVEPVPFQQEEPQVPEIQDKAAEMLQQGSTIQRVEMPHVTAISVQKSRLLRWDNMKGMLYKEAEEAKEEAYFAWPTEGQEVFGPSIHLARAAMNAWGNCGLTLPIVEELGNGKRRLACYFLDRENGVVWPAIHEYTPTAAPKKFAKSQDQRDRWDNMQLNSHVSRLYRKAIESGVSRGLLNGAARHAQKAFHKQLEGEDPTVSAAKAIKALGDFGVTRKQVIAKIGREPGQWSRADIENLRTAWAAIKNGEALAAELFPDPELGTLDDTDTKAQLGEILDNGKGKAKKGAVALAADSVKQKFEKLDGAKWADICASAELDTAAAPDAMTPAQLKKVEAKLDELLEKQDAAKDKQPATA